MNDIPLTVVRPRYIEQPSMEMRNISGLAAASGSGTETGTTATGLIIPTGIAGTGLYGFPGVSIYSESGGSLAATAYFYDESGNEQGSANVKTCSVAGTVSVTSGTQTMSVASGTSSWYSFGVSGDAAKTYYLAWTVTATYTGYQWSCSSIEIESGSTISNPRSYRFEDIYSGLVKLDNYYVDTYTKFSGPITVPTGALIRARFTTTGTQSASCPLRLITVT